MPTLATLRRRAHDRANARGHKLGKFKRMPSLGSSAATCKVCGHIAYVEDGMIKGAAVQYDCDDLCKPFGPDEEGIEE